MWSIGSRVTAGTVYTVDLIADESGVRTLCDCQAGATERVCWHRAAVRMAALDDLPAHDCRAPRDPWPAVDDAEAYAAV